MSGLVLGSWPGRESDHNRFLPILLDALAAEGVAVASFPDSRDIDLRGLDALLVHWPDKVFWEARSSREAAGLIGRLLAKLSSRPARAKLVWMVHDLRPPELDGAEITEVLRGYTERFEMRSKVPASFRVEGAVRSPDAARAACLSSLRSSSTVPTRQLSGATMRTRKSPGSCLCDRSSVP